MFLPFLIINCFIGGLFCWISERIHLKISRWIALMTMFLTLIISVYLWLKGEYFLAKITKISEWQSIFSVPWIPRFGINFSLGIDGLSMLMINLSALFGLISVLSSWKIKKKIGAFYLNLMWIVGSAIGVFLAVDMFLFFFFWEMMAIPMCFLISLWGHKSLFDRKNRIKVALKFLIYSQISALILLVGILFLVFVHYYNTGVLTFSYEKLLKTRMSHIYEYLLMLCFFIAFIIKMPLIPLHGWLVDAHTFAPTVGSVDLAGILVKTAPYALLRFNLSLFPETSKEFSFIAMLIGIISIFYASWIAFSQIDIKRLIAYASVSHMGFLLIGIYAGNQLAFQGVILQMISQGISTAALFILSGQLYDRLHTRDIRKMGGLWSAIKWMPGLSLFFLVANIGLPGTGNFVGEFMISIGAFQTVPIIILFATFGFVFVLIYSLNMMQHIYYGKLKSETSLQKMSNRELLIIVILLILLVFLGIYPQPVLNTTYAITNSIQNYFEVV